MFSDTKEYKHIYMAFGYTDLRQGIDGLAAKVKHDFELDPGTDSFFANIAMISFASSSIISLNKISEFFFCRILNLFCNNRHIYTFVHDV